MGQKYIQICSKKWVNQQKVWYVGMFGKTRLKHRKQEDIMGPNRCYLITLYDGATLLRVALKAEREVEYFMEPDGKEELMRQLPNHCQSYGKIVHIEELFEITVKPEMR